MNPILVENKNGIAVLTINRPEALNALNQDVFDALDEFFEEGYKAFESLLGVVITGNGEKAFVAGADIKKFLELDESSGSELSKRGQEILFKMEAFHLPVIAAVNGFALGGGCELAMACHIRIASANAKFGQPEVNLGLIPGYGGTQRLVQLVGKGKAFELLLTGDMIDANEAHRIGLVNQVVEAGQALEAALKMVEKIASKGPKACQVIIDGMNLYFKDRDRYFYESAEFGRLMASDEGKEGATAFIEKRKPQFRK